MTNTLELEVAIKRSGLTKRSIANSLGISEVALYNKISNTSEFKASEIMVLSDMLKLKDCDRDMIFFAK